MIYILLCAFVGE